jgi:hypothetical protein
VDAGLITDAKRAVSLTAEAKAKKLESNGNNCNEALSTEEAQMLSEGIKDQFLRQDTEGTNGTTYGTGSGNGSGNGTVQDEQELGDDATSMNFGRQTTGEFCRLSTNSSALAMSASPSSSNGVDFISLQYHKSQEEPAKVFNLVTGVRVHLPAELIISSEQAFVEGMLEFAADPPLPEGLVLDGKTGLISGTPVFPQGSVAVYVITISIKACGPGGLEIGSLPLTSCSLPLRIWDLQKFQLDKAAMDSNGRLTMLLQFC